MFNLDKRISGLIRNLEQAQKISHSLPEISYTCKIVGRATDSCEEEWTILLKLMKEGLLTINVAKSENGIVSSEPWLIVYERFITGKPIRITLSAKFYLLKLKYKIPSIDILFIVTSPLFYLYLIFVLLRYFFVDIVWKHKIVSSIAGFILIIISLALDYHFSLKFYHIA